MPKMKPHSGMAKRTRVTGTGKVMTQSANNTHKFAHKSGSQKRRLDSLAIVSRTDLKRVKKLLGR
ncbi:MAG TPA: 50S ribosomal protein L35 [Micromonosporaceae bacterium]|nr:50S ribosomal protein L35 [Micromonosporaceae bacterium]